MRLRNDTVVHVWKWWEDARAVASGGRGPACLSLSRGCPGAASPAWGEAGWAPELRRVTGQVSVTARVSRVSAPEKLKPR